jgi:hypothetical protein
MEENVHGHLNFIGLPLYWGYPQDKEEDKG